jgi:hypothetical protein
MNRWVALLGVCVGTVAAGSIAQQKSEEARAMIAALEHVKSTQRGPFLLSPLVSGPGRVPHDSALLAEISSVALRVAAPAPPYVLDTFVLSIERPRRTGEGTYSVRAGGYYASNSSGGCRVGGPSINYTIRCSGGECRAEVVSQATGSGRCE